MDTVLSVVVVTAIGLVVGAIFLWRRDGPGKQVWLMLLLAAIMVVNVLIWTIPDATGAAPADRIAEGATG